MPDPVPVRFQYVGRKVCSGKLTLAAARNQIRVYKRMTASSFGAAADARRCLRSGGG
jgi:hypothetical protein